jgi:hypothetical protein
MAKQFLLVLDEAGVRLLSTLVNPNIIHFLEVQGMQHNGVTVITCVPETKVLDEDT